MAPSIHPLPISVFFLLCLTLGCSTTEDAVRPTPVDPRCVLTCDPARDCSILDHDLVKARQLMVKCVGQQAGKGHVGQAHGCYRAVRLLESARWWLTTLQVPDLVNRVYQPSPSRHRAFLCAIQRLGKCRTVQEVERRYLEMIRYYP